MATKRTNTRRMRGAVWKPLAATKQNVSVFIASYILPLNEMNALKRALSKPNWESVRMFARARSRARPLEMRFHYTTTKIVLHVLLCTMRRALATH